MGFTNLLCIPFSSIHDIKAHLNNFEETSVTTYLDITKSGSTEIDSSSVQNTVVHSPRSILLYGGTQLHIQQEVAKSFAENADHNSFFVANLSVVYKQHQRWLRYLPEVRPFYAIKCNSDPYVLQLLARLGTGFDCASLAEIHMALAAMGSASSSYDHLSKVQRIIFASPCKFNSDIRGACRLNIHTSTFDNADELDKISQFYPNMQLVIRILADDSHSRWPLGRKFGAHLQIVPALLKKAKELNLQVIGVSFHVGSSCSDSSVFLDSIWRARQVFDIAKDVGYNLTLLDVGGGFEEKINPCTGGNLFEENAKAISKALQEYFPKIARPEGFEVIAEPGRYYVTEAFQLVTNVIARRGPIEGLETFKPEPIPVPGKEGLEIADLMIYLNDGTYGGLSNVLLDHKKAVPYVIAMGKSFDVQEHLNNQEPVSIWGPTLDSVDCINPWAMLPCGIRVGDWLGFTDMGAYTLCATTKFNGFNSGHVVYTTGEGIGGEAVWDILASK